MSAVEFLKDLINIPSLSGCEEEVARRLQDEFKKLSYDEIIEAGGNICGRIGSGKITVLYDAHMDVVEAGGGWDGDPFKVRVEGENIIGRGTCDDKGTLAAMVYGGARCRAGGVKLYVLGSVKEEVAEGNGLKEFLNKTGIKPDFIVIGEPSSLRVARGNRGRLGIRIDIRGKSSHASQPSQGINAIYRASKVVEEIKKLNDELSTGSEPFADSVAVTKIETANKNINVIPEKCSIYCDYRSTLGVKKEDILNHFKKFIDCGDEILAITPYYLPWEIPEGHNLIKAGGECMEAVFGRKEIIIWVFCTNGSYTAGELGIPTMGFGPGSESQCHSAEEKIDIGSINKAVDFFAELPDHIKKNV